MNGVIKCLIVSNILFDVYVYLRLVYVLVKNKIHNPKVKKKWTKIKISEINWEIFSCNFIENIVTCTGAC